MDYLDYYNSLPLISLIVSALLLLLFVIIYKDKKHETHYFSLILLLVNLFIVIYNFDVIGYAFNQMLIFNKLSHFFIILILIGSLLTILFSKNYLIKSGYNYSEFYILIFFSLVGMVLMVTANDLIIVFLGIEVMSIPFYVLAGFFRKREKSNESSLKYFLLGSFATGFLLYGLALIYGISTSTNFSKISILLPNLSQNLTFLIGVSLLLVGLSFKIAAFPFHSYAPDVYEGSPTTISGFFSSVGKISAFAIIILLFYNVLNKEIIKIKEILIIISVLSMLIGSIIAIVQKDIKRMLAYSSISHAGYVLIGIISQSNYGYYSVIYYLFVYLFMQICAFGLVSILENEKGENTKIANYYGLGKNNPLIAFFISIMMLSLAGIPPFGGFFAKYYIFLAAIQSGFIWLAIFGAIISVISVYFYINVIQVMYFKDSYDSIEYKIKWNELLSLGLSTIILLLTGIFPETFINSISTLF